MRTDQNFRDDAAAAKIGEASRGLTQPVVLRRAPREAAAGEGIQRVDLGMGGPRAIVFGPCPPLRPPGVAGAFVGIAAGGRVPSAQNENAALLLSEARIIASAIGVPVEVEEPCAAAEAQAEEAHAGASGAEPAYHSEVWSTTAADCLRTRREAAVARTAQLGRTH